MNSRKIISAVTGIAIGLAPSLILSPSAAADEFSMSLTGIPSLNQTMTIQFNDGVTPVDTYFDIWMCPDKTVVPRDDGDWGDCDVVTFWNRSDVENFGYNAGQDPVLSMKWVLSTEPTPGLRLNGDPYLDAAGNPMEVTPPGYEEDEPEQFGGWCEYDGWFFSVNDFEGGSNSNWSAAFNATGCDSAPAPEPAPEAPGTPIATAGNGQATVQVTPTESGSDPVTYTVTANPGGVTCTITAPATSCTVTGLTNGTAYTFSSTATNAGGTSAASVSSNSVTPSAPAPTPTPTATPTTAPAAALATTGANLEWLMVAGFLAVIAGSGFLAFSRRKRIW
jgi:LPXTG-motif cell wall-anchored protein